MATYGPTPTVFVTSARPYYTTYYTGANSQKMIDAFSPAERQAQKAINDRKQLVRFIIPTGGDDDTAVMIINWVHNRDVSDTDFDLRTIQNTNLEKIIQNTFGEMINFYATARAMGLKRDVQGQSLRNAMIEYVSDRNTILSKEMFGAAIDQLDFDKALIYKLLKETWIKLGRDPNAASCRRDFRAWCEEEELGDELRETIARIERERRERR